MLVLDEEESKKIDEIKEEKKDLIETIKDALKDNVEFFKTMCELFINANK